MAEKLYTYKDLSQLLQISPRHVYRILKQHNIKPFYLSRQAPRITPGQLALISGVTFDGQLAPSQERQSQRPPSKLPEPRYRDLEGDL